MQVVKVQTQLLVLLQLLQLVIHYTQTAASVGYAVTSGVSATIGYSDRSRSTENTANPTNSGTSWYIGADVSF